MKAFEPITIRGMKVKNRIVMTGMGVGIGRLEGKRAKRFYVERARGGVGIIIAGATFVTTFASDEAYSQSGDFTSFIKNISDLPKEVHEAGAKIGIQFAHLNRFPPGLSLLDTRGEPIAPSPRIESNPPLHFLKPGEKMRALTIEEIETIISQFGKSAARAKEAGFDFVEIMAAHGLHLPCQFFSPLYNHRSDKYGGDLPKRMRFGIECIRAMRESVGDDYPIFFRIGSEEKHPEGINVADSIEYALALEKAGVNVIDVSTADHPPYIFPGNDQPMGTFAYLASAIRQKVKVPVITVGRINTPEVAETILSEGKADFLGICRQLIADPFWPEKVATGKINEITPCLGCNKCLEPLYVGGVLRCTVNPWVAREEEYYNKIKIVEKPKKIMEIGGGPAAMEAARVAAIRGHKVTLWEEEDRLGGQLLMAGLIPYKDRFKNLTNYFVGQLEKRGVQVKLGRKATLKEVEESKPDVVIVATGVKSFIPDIPGVEKSNVITSIDVLSGKAEVGDKVVIIGGESMACDLAQWLVQKGKKVTMVRRGPTMASKMLPPFRRPLLDELTAKGVTMLTQVRYEEITEKGLIITSKEGEKQIIEADTIVLAAGVKANDALTKELEGKVASLYSIGDCLEPKGLREAISKGSNIGCEI